MPNGRCHRKIGTDKVCPRCEGTGRIRDPLLYRLKKLAPFKGQELTTEQILHICDYSPKTSLCDTLIFKRGLIKNIKPERWCNCPKERWLVMFASLEAKEVWERIKGE